MPPWIPWPCRFQAGGAYTLAGGSVGKLALDMSGAGSVDIGAPVIDATISMSGAGEVKIAARHRQFGA